MESIRLVCFPRYPGVVIILPLWCETPLFTYEREPYVGLFFFVDFFFHLRSSSLLAVKGIFASPAFRSASATPPHPFSLPYSISYPLYCPSQADVSLRHFAM